MALVRAGIVMLGAFFGQVHARAKLKSLLHVITLEVTFV